VLADLGKLPIAVEGVRRIDEVFAIERSSARSTDQRYRRRAAACGP